MDTKWIPNLCNYEKYYELWKVELSELQKHCSAHQPHCAVPQHILLLHYLSVLHCLLCCVSSLCFDVSAVSVISPSLPLSHASWFPLGKSTAPGQ